MKVAIQFHRIGPYHAARLEGAVNAGMEVVAIELSGKDNTYAWDVVEDSAGSKRVTLFPDSDADDLSYAEIASTLDKTLRELQPDVLAVNGWASQAAYAAMSWSQAHSVPAVVMSESTPWDFKRVCWKELIKKQLMRFFSAGLVGGKAHCDYLSDLGMNENAIFLGYNAVDNDYFTEHARKGAADSANLPDIPKAPFFLASGRFIEKKNFLRLIEAYSAYRNKLSGEPWDMVILGDGDLRADIEQKIHELNLDEHVHLPGFKQIEELPIWYATASCFVHVSTTEQWGLVVNEAMASGLPVIVSHTCGCACELVRNGENGYEVDPYSEKDIAGSMERVTMLDTKTLETMGQRSQAIVSDYGPERFGAGMKAACEYAESIGPSRVGLVARIILKCLAR